MTQKLFKTNYFYLILVSLYAGYINWVSGNIGVMPIDTFGFFDTGFSILKDKFPIRDFWIFTGITVDYLQAFFFIIFGKEWSSYIIHASIINIIASLSFFLFLDNFKINKAYQFIFSISFATLCYPVSGTPFAYLHSFVFSLILIFTFCSAIINDNKFLWFLIPTISLFAFFSMQTPSFYIITIITFFILFFLLKEKKTSRFKYLILGTFFALTLIFIFFISTKTPLKNFIYQYFLFPLTIGSDRLTSESTAYVSLLDQLNLQRIIGDFKFIHIFLIPLILFTFLRKNILDNKQILVNIVFITCAIIFIFNQLITANQIYIFSLIPILGSILLVNLQKEKNFKTLSLILITILALSTYKFHIRYNLEKKFHDLENVDKKQSIKAEVIDDKLKYLNWVSPVFESPQEEVDLIKTAISVISNDSRKKIVITHYQFLSLVLDEDLNILNRWYLWDNNTHPTENHKYFDFYKKFTTKNFEQNEISVIYLLGSDDEIPFSKIKNYFIDKCFKNITIIDKRFSVHELKKC